MTTLPEEFSGVNGYVLWEGPAYLDDAPLAVIATGFTHPSENGKTGPQIQACVIRTDIPPHVAVFTGQDISVCGSCPLRPHTVRQEVARLGLRAGEKPPMCYVSAKHSIRGKYEAYHRGIYPRLPIEYFPLAFARRSTRLGEYGNFSNLPFELVECVVKYSTKGWTMYEHDWARKRNQPLAEFAMASVGSVRDKRRANDLGWRTFRVKQPDQAILKDEVECPFYTHNVQCIDCKLCQGTRKFAKNIVTNDHGPTSRVLADKRHPQRMSLQVV